MPKYDVAVVKKPKPEVYAVAALLAGGGGLLIWLALKGKGGQGLPPGHQLSGLQTVTFTVPSIQIPVDNLNPVPVLDPIASYSGPGLDVYTFAGIEQIQAGRRATVYGSGVAGVHVGPPNGVGEVLSPYHLVSPDQPQPPSYTDRCPRQSLCMFPWPGPGEPNFPPGYGICGAPPQRGPAIAVVEVFLNAATSGNAADADGFSSPTCNPRRWVLRREWPIITFV